MAVLCAFLLAGFDVAVAGNTSGVRPEAVALRASEIESLAANDSNSFVLSLGDRLKISFFETFEAGRDAGLSHVERVELSGEYTVQQDGNMFPAAARLHDRSGHGLEAAAGAARGGLSRPVRPSSGGERAARRASRSMSSARCCDRARSSSRPE